MPMPYKGGKAASDKRYREGNREAISAYCKAHYRINREKVISRVKAYQITNRESVNARHRNWASRNPEKIRAKGRAWAKKNAALVSFYARERQLMQIMAQPPWVKREDILPFYVEAHRRSLIEGIDYQVDHIWPIKHKLFCGLHVPWNLRVITRSENARKCNRSHDELATTSI